MDHFFYKMNLWFQRRISGFKDNHNFQRQYNDFRDSTLVSVAIWKCPSKKILFRTSMSPSSILFRIICFRSRKQLHDMNECSDECRALSVAFPLCEPFVFDGKIHSDILRDKNASSKYERKYWRILVHQSQFMIISSRKNRSNSSTGQIAVKTSSYTVCCIQSHVQFAVRVQV